MNVDLINEHFGNLTVLEKAGKSSWLCKCKCGNTIVVTTSCLLLKHTRSCGCLYRKSYKQGQDKMREFYKNASPEERKEYKDKDLISRYTKSSPNKDNKTSKRKGVCFSKSVKRYLAYINKDGKRVYLGAFIHEIDAIKAREKAEQEIIQDIKQEKLNK